MTLSAETFSILRNFAAINKLLLIEPGNILQTTAASGVLARATVEEEFPVEISIYDTGHFLAVAGLFHNPDFDFGPTCIRLTGDDGEAQVQYRYSARLFTSKSLKTPGSPKRVFEFDLPEDKWSAVQKAASVLNKGEVRIVADGESVEITTFDHKNPHTHTFSMPLAANPNGIRCEQILSISNLQLLKGPYRGTVSSRFTKFEHAGEIDLKYWIACDPQSTFD